MKKIHLLLPMIVITATILACASPALLQPGSILPTSTVAIPTPARVEPAVPMVISDTQDQLVNIYDKVSPGVVAIQVLTDSGDGMGSGFVYDMQGHIITNYHVVEGATELEVDFPSGYKTTGKVIGVDTDSDIAVIKVDAPEEELYPVMLGDSGQVKVGQTVVAIGNPFGLNSTMTMGIVSALGRTLDSAHATPDGQVYTAGDLIQTDAAINPGNSGGPLLNLNGEVIGINRAIRTAGDSISGDTGNIGIGFAISINIVKRVVPQLIAHGKYDYPYLGLSSLPDISLAAQKALGLDRAVGAYIVDIAPGSPAEQAGLRLGTVKSSIQGLMKGGDLIIAIDGQSILTFGDLLKYLINQKSPGDTVILTILRDEQEKEITLTLGSRP
ncbi:MAG: trypsin [Anaerolinea sp.]|nr:trypsin [Anaerolinea sp.]